MEDDEVWLDCGLIVDSTCELELYSGLFLVGALSNILVFLGEEREWLRVDREGENEPR